MTKKEKATALPLQAHQGDIFFEKVTSIPKGFRYNAEKTAYGRIVLAEGEITGHFHALEEDTDTVVLTGDDNAAIEEMILHVRNPEGVTVTHPEHGPITLEPGLWKVARQREYEHGSETRDKEAKARIVAD